MSDTDSPFSVVSSSTMTSDDNPPSQSQNENDIRSLSQTQVPSQSLSDTHLYATSPLAQSLITLSSHPNCPAVAGFFDNVAEDDQPRRLSFMPDTADYFVDIDGQPIRLVFPAELDMEGKFSRAGAYFNLPETVSQNPWI